MKKIQLTQNKYTIVDDEDYDYLNQWNWCSKKNINIYYAIRTVLNKRIYMHRIIINPTDNMYIDHINRNGLDNRKENLRICNKSQNACNSTIPRHNTSGIKGVCWDKSCNKWLSRIKINGKQKHLGRFNNKLEAREVYRKEAKDHFGEFYSDSIKKEDKELINEINNIKDTPKERLRITNTSEIKGVHWDKRSKKWISQIVINSKNKYLGMYNCIADAKAAYDVATGNIDHQEVQLEDILND